MESLIDIKRNMVNVDLFHYWQTMARKYPDREDDLWDSFGKNQFISKRELLTVILDSGIVDKDLHVSIVGSWYGSILVPVLAPLVKSIRMIDIDEETNKISKRIWKEDWKVENISWTHENPYEKHMNSFGGGRTGDAHQEGYKQLVINTSCEHMGPLQDLFDMQRLPYAKNPNLWFAIQSNNMFGIQGHINCKHGMDEFKEEFSPSKINAEIIEEREIKEERGTRFFLFGKLIPNPMKEFNRVD